MALKKSFFERLTGGARFDDDEEENSQSKNNNSKTIGANLNINGEQHEGELHLQEEEEGQLTVDLYQTPSEIVIQTMVSGVQPENLSITITRDMIIVKGKREENQSISSENYFIKELFWGSFSRTISLPEEIDPEEATAIEKHGLLIIRLPKIDKNKQTSLKVKSV